MPALAEHFVVDVDATDRCDRQGSPPWPNFCNYVILADIYRTQRGIMRVGVFYFPIDYGIDITELARALEERGFASLYVPEHTHIPTSRRTPFPGGGELPKRYAHTHDQFPATPIGTYPWPSRSDDPLHCPSPPRCGGEGGARPAGLGE